MAWRLPAILTACITWLSLFFRAPFDADFISNPDALVRLERIRQWMDGSGWYNHALRRVGADPGPILHWSRPLDVLVAVGAWPLSAFMDERSALLMAAMGLALGAYICAVVAVFWLMLRVIQIPAWGAGLAALSFTILPDIMVVFAAPGWPDHHGLMIVSFILSIGFAWRMARDGTNGWAFGTVLGLAIWVSPESFVPLVALYSGLTLIWIKDANPDIAREALKSTGTLFAVILIALLIEYATIWPGLALDRLSTFSALTALVTCGFWFALWFAPPVLTASPLRRGLMTLAVTGVGIGIILAIAPHARFGPMADADPWFAHAWTGMFGDGFRFVVWDVWVLIAAALMVLVALRRPQAFALFAPLLLMSAVLSGLNSTRWITYGETLALIILIWGFTRVWPTLQALGDGAKGIAARTTSLAAIFVAPMLLNLATVASENMIKAPIPLKGTSSQPCLVQDILPVLNAYPRTRILAHPNVTPTLLFFTHHDVVSIPIHPNAQAVHTSVRILMATDDTTALKRIKETGTGLIIVCPNHAETRAYGTDPNGLYARILRGEVPNWLRPVETGHRGFLVFRVKN